MEDRKTENTENINDPNTAGGTGAAISGPEKQDSGNEKKSSGLLLKIVLVLAVLILAGGAYGWYYWNLPSQRIARILEEADVFLQDGSYQEAVDGYAQALEIDGSNAAAIEGYLQARMAIADNAAKAEDIPGRAQACGLYEELIAFCDEKSGTTAAAQQPSVIDAMRAEAKEKLTRLRSEIAADYVSVNCVTKRDDRSGKVVLTDGTQIPYSWYYDLVQIDDVNYPLAEEINSRLEMEKEAFFSVEHTDPSQNISGNTAQKGTEYLDYVGLSGIYSGDGILSIGMAEIRVAGKARAGFFRGKTIRLSDGKELTLGEVTDRTDSGLRHLVKKKIRERFEQEGYTISMSDVEDYLEETDPNDLKYYIHEDGNTYLVIDQSVPFFNTAGEILEIPLD